MRLFKTACVIWPTDRRWMLFAAALSTGLLVGCEDSTPAASSTPVQAAAAGSPETLPSDADGPAAPPVPPPAEPRQPAPHEVMPAKILEITNNQRQKPLTAQLNNDIHRQLYTFKNTTNAPAVCVAWATADYVRGAVCVGMVDAAEEIPLQPRSTMPAGEVSRTYLAALVMDQQARQYVDLDAPLTRYLGDEPWLTTIPNAADATIRMLLSHTSGIPDYRDSESFRRIVRDEPDHVWTPIELFRFAAERPAVFPHGKAFAVSHTNDVLLVLLVQLVEGREYWPIVAEKVLHPLEAALTRPMWERFTEKLVPGYVDAQKSIFGVAQTADEQTFLRNPEFAWLGGEMVSAPFDLVHWARRLYGGEVVPRGVLAEMREGRPTSPGGSVQYGLGTQVRRSAHGEVTGHRGAFEGYRTEIAYYDDLKIALAAQVNSTMHVTAEQVSALLDACAPLVAAKRDALQDLTSP